MNYILESALLPFWILGVPFIVALIILTQLRARREHIARSRTDVDAGGTQLHRTL